MQPKQVLLYAALLLVYLVVVALLYIEQRQAALAQINLEFNLAARSAPGLLASDYHDRMARGGLVSDTEQLRYKAAFSRQAGQVGVDLLATLVITNNQFTIAACSEGTLHGHGLTGLQGWQLFDVATAGLLRNAYEAPAPVFGRLRIMNKNLHVALIREVSEQGTYYLACAGQFEEAVSARLTGDLVQSLARASALLLFPMALLITYVRSRQKFFTQIQLKAAELEATLASVPDAYIIYDAKGRIVRMNPEAKRYFRYDEKTAGLPLEDRLRLMGHIFPEVDASNITESPQHKALRGESPAIEIFSVQHPGAAECWLEMTTSPILGVDGKPAGAFAIFKDITEQRNYEQILQRYRVLFDEARDIIFLMKPDGNILEANRAAEEAYGYTHRQFESKIARDLRAPDTRDQVDNQLKQALETGVLFETWHMRRDGSRFPVEVSSRRILVHGQPLLLSVIRDISARKEAEEALARARDFAESIINTAQVLVVVLDETGNILRINPYAAELCGYTTEELAGRNWFDTMLPDYEKKRVTGIFDDVKTATQVRRGRNPIRTRSGEERLIEWSSVTLSANEQVVGILSIGQDITERQQMEEALLISEERYRGLFENSPVALWEADFSRVKQFADSLEIPADTSAAAWLASSENFLGQVAQGIRIIGANQAMVALYGASNLQELFNRAEETLSPEQLQVHAFNIAQMRAGLQGGEDEIVLHTFDGEARNAIMRWVVMPGYEENYKRVLISIVDVTEQKRAEQAARDVARQFELFMDQVPASVFIKDANSVMLYANSYLRGVLGIENWIGREPEEVLDAETASLIRQADQDALQLGLSMVVETLIDFEGNSRYFETRRFPIHREEAEDQLGGIAVDVTELRKAQSELHKLNTQLEERVVQRTEELAAANQELEAFTYSVSHDLRAPLRAINGFAEILIEDWSGQVDGEVIRLLGQIKQSAEQLSQLVEDLLRFSRLGRQSLHKLELDPLVIVKEALKELALATGNLRVKLGDLPKCKADPALLRQVYINLLSNAIKFSSHQEKPCIEVGAQSQGKRTVYFVRDKGVGFDMAQAEKVFGVFQRLHKPEEYEGTGVGLAIVYNIIRRHGGQIWAEAEPNKGACFYFTLGGRQPR